jgi:DtxR family Mn-dependent transcriptional regulator
VRLTTLAEGERGRVTCLEEPGGPAAATLAAMGVLPGAYVELVQRFPAFVFRLGYAEFGVDEELASRIRVLPD